MCGRFVVARAASDLVSLFDVEIIGEQLPDRSWNIAPTRPVSVIIDSVQRDDAEAPPVRRIEAARWGLVPTWTKELTGGPPLFNARIETAAEKPSFRGAVASRRAVVPASGYYEWKSAGDAKVPHFIHPAEADDLLCFAALYEWWRDPTAAADDPARWLLSTSILTRSATGRLADIHDRMPVFLPLEHIDDWLDPHSVGDEALLEVVADAAESVAEELDAHVVGAGVGSVRNDDPTLIEPV